MLFLVRVCLACGTVNAATSALCARCCSNIQSVALESLAELASQRHSPGLHPRLPGPGQDAGQ
jgi:hypothetical protein